MAFQVESFQKPVLLVRQPVQGQHWFCTAVLAAINQCDFLNLRERHENPGDAHLDALLCQRASKQRTEQERKDAVEGMDADFLIRPVMKRAPTDEVRILHALEGFLYDTGPGRRER